MATLINQGHNATNKTQVENLELASQLLNFPESGTSSSSSRSRSSPLSTTQAKGSMPAAEFMKSGKSQQNLFTLQNQILDKLTSLRSEKSLEKEPQALDYSSTLEAPPSLPVEPESHSNAPPLNDSEEGTLTTSFMGKGEVLSDEESFLPLEITICLEESFSRDKSSSDDGSGSNYSPLNEKTEIPDLVQEPTPPVEITIDKFPKAHRNNSTRDEQYWMPQRENLRTMIKAFKEGRIVCINGENHSVQEYGNETKIYEKVAQIYKIRRKNLYKVLDRIGIRKISKVTQWTPEIIEELRRKADEGLGYRDLENYFKSDRRDIQAICLQNNIHVHPKVRSKTLTLRNFTEKQIEEIKEFSKRGFTHLQIAKKMKTTKAIIYSILKRGGKTARVYWTTEQVQELIRLKETTNLPWKAIAEYFPGKSAQSVKDKYRSEKAKRRKKRKVPPSNSVYEALEKKNSKRGKPN